MLKENKETDGLEKDRGPSWAQLELVVFPTYHTGPASDSSPHTHTCLHEYNSQDSIKEAQSMEENCLCKEKMGTEATVLHLFSPLS